MQVAINLLVITFSVDPVLNCFFVEEALSRLVKETVNKTFLSSPFNMLLRINAVKKVDLSHGPYDQQEHQCHQCLRTKNVKIVLEIILLRSTNEK